MPYVLLIAFLLGIAGFAMTAAIRRMRGKKLVP